MYNLIWSDYFKKKMVKFLNKNPQLKSDFKNTINMLIENPYHNSLKNHKLKGRLKGKIAVRLSYSYRIIIDIKNNNIFLLNIGTHDEVYE